MPSRETLLVIKNRARAIKSYLMKSLGEKEYQRLRVECLKSFSKPNDDDTDRTHEISDVIMEKISISTNDEKSNRKKNDSIEESDRKYC